MSLGGMGCLYGSHLRDQGAGASNDWNWNTSENWDAKQWMLPLANWRPSVHSKQFNWLCHEKMPSAFHNISNEMLGGALDNNDNYRNNNILLVMFYIKLLFKVSC